MQQMQTFQLLVNNLAGFQVRNVHIKSIIFWKNGSCDTEFSLIFIVLSHRINIPHADMSLHSVTIIMPRQPVFVLEISLNC
jgi:hypothetical protein